MEQHDQPTPQEESPYRSDMGWAIDEMILSIEMQQPTIRIVEFTLSTLKRFVYQCTDYVWHNAVALEELRMKAEKVSSRSPLVFAIADQESKKIQWSRPMGEAVKVWRVYL